MSYRVEITDRAKQDLERILIWLSKRSAQGAVSWFMAWEEACDFLAKNAHMTSIAPEDVDHVEEIRQWTFRTPHGHRYRVLLILRGTTVFVINVRGSGQQFVTKSELGAPDA